MMRDGNKMRNFDIWKFLIVLMSLSSHGGMKLGEKIFVYYKESTELSRTTEYLKRWETISTWRVEYFHDPTLATT